MNGLGGLNKSPNGVVIDLGTAAILNSWCGQREADILAATAAEHRGGVLRVEQNKTSAHVRLPIDKVQALVTRLTEQQRRNARVLADRAPRPLRHTAVVRLAEAGCEIAEIISITGHTLAGATKILERYHVRTKKQAKSAFGKRIAAALAAALEMANDTAIEIVP